MRLVDTDDKVATLRVGESNNLAKQTVARICLEIATSRPGVGPAALTGSSRLNSRS